MISLLWSPMPWKRSPSRSGRGLFLYLALRKDRANLALARHRLRTIEQALEI